MREKRGIALLLILAMALTLCGCKSTDYKEALALLESGDFTAAEEAFETLGDYKDSALQAASAAYGKAEAFFEEGDYRDAIEAFESLGDYEDSAARIAEVIDAAMAKARELLAQGDEAAADRIFEALGDKLDLGLARYLKQSAALRGAAVGDEVRFGAWEQDGDPANGSEELSWLVLAVDDDRAMLLSRDVIDCQAYHDAQTQVRWAGSALRGWLNGEFLRNAFTTEHRGRIVTTEVVDYKGLDSTEDQVFLLHPIEVSALLGQAEQRSCAASKAAGADGAKAWWMRSGGEGDVYCLTVNAEGVYGGHFVDEKLGVRPVIWVTLDEDNPGSGLASSAPEPVVRPDPTAPGPDDILGIPDNVTFPNDDAWMERIWLKCVNCNIRAYVRLRAEADDENNGFADDGAVVTMYARQNGYSLVQTDDGRFGWITARLLKNDHP